MLWLKHRKTAKTKSNTIILSLICLQALQIGLLKVLHQAHFAAEHLYLLFAPPRMCSLQIGEWLVSQLTSILYSSYLSEAFPSQRYLKFQYCPVLPFSLTSIQHTMSCYLSSLLGYLSLKLSCYTNQKKVFSNTRCCF